MRKLQPTLTPKGLAERESSERLFTPCALRWLLGLGATPLTQKASEHAAADATLVPKQTPRAAEGAEKVKKTAPDS